MNFRLDTNHHLLFALSFGGFLFISILISVAPAVRLEQKVQAMKPEYRHMTEAQERGLRVFVRENCAACHTQQVRNVRMDEQWGRPSEPRDYAYLKPLSTWIMTPMMLGSARVGPDLANVGNRRDNDMWNFIHLYEPRSVVPESIMPSYKWLFEAKENPQPGELLVTVPGEFRPDGKVLAPTQDAKDLLSFLMRLKQEKDKDQN
ncbi:MAG: hypothetical protein GX103_00790 [Bacteroidales bacterium]|nr:hypothetical protein [Bacteroidales bacterium]